MKILIKELQYVASQLKKRIKAGNKFVVTIEKMKSGYDSDKGKEEIVQKKEFDDKNDAEKFVKQAMKKYKLQRHADHIVNYKDQIELLTNY